jgi:hypothetical protein
MRSPLVLGQAGMQGRPAATSGVDAETKACPPTPGGVSAPVVLREASTSSWRSRPSIVFAERDGPNQTFVAQVVQHVVVNGLVMVNPEITVGDDSEGADCRHHRQELRGRFKVAVE